MTTIYKCNTFFFNFHDYFISFQFSSIQFSSVQFSSVQFSSVQFSSVQFILFYFILFYFILFACQFVKLCMLNIKGDKNISSRKPHLTWLFVAAVCGPPADLGNERAARGQPKGMD